MLYNICFSLNLNYGSARQPAHILTLAHFKTMTFVFHFGIIISLLTNHKCIYHYWFRVTFIKDAFNT